MADFGILSHVTVELRRQIFAALQATPDTDFGLAGIVDRITLQSPGEDLDAAAVASLYLYHLDINQHCRNRQPLPDRALPDRFRRPPLPMQLRYLFTPVGDDETVNQLLLGRVLQHFHDFPSFADVSGRPIGDAFGGASPELRVKPDLLSLEQLAQMWNAFSAPYRVSLGLLVEVVAVDSAVPPERLRRVEELAGGLGKVVP
ncbi:DUF4255 domain-containing protein (plasmid) [Cereibacter azotoformans]|uniref:DUF4255 domain-containing protein n=1 Tax=Cereibacter TaxID=1653176 RepID=UPI0011AABCC5|nr:DUF4255 domain-containing protein [Cereibacter sediminicola]